ncbi:MAG: 3'-5' exonuclease [Vulcanococcus sp.]
MSEGAEATPSETSSWEQADLLSLVAANPSRRDTPVAPVDPPLPAPETVAPETVLSEAVSLEAASAGSVTTLLIIDTETTGLQPGRDQCIEVGAVLFSVPDRSVLSQVSFLMPAEQNPAQGVNGIAPALTQRPQPWKSALACFEAMVEAADLLVAHNAAFDRQWFGQGPLPALTKPWLCSMEDVRWPADRHLRANPSVRDLALAYEVPVWAAHRALTDCIYLAQVFERCEQLEALLSEGLEPRRLYRARLSYEERHKAREAGFRWNEPVSGAWSRRLSEREVNRLDFPVVPVEESLERRIA